MNLAAIALLISAVAFAGANAANLIQRDLRVETADTDAVLRDDELGPNEDFWGSWYNDYAGLSDSQEHNEPFTNDYNSASGNGEHDDAVGDLPAAAKDVLQKAEFVVTAALPFEVDSAKSLVLPIALVVAALLVIAVAAVLIGVRRQQLSEPMFGPVELASDLPVPMTTSAAIEVEEDSDSDSDHADDTGAMILAAELEEEEKEEEDVVVALA